MVYELMNYDMGFGLWVIIIEFMGVFCLSFFFSPLLEQMVLGSLTI